MTATIDTTTATTEPATEHTNPGALGTVFAQVDPTTLDVADNVRDTVDLDRTPDFVASIREHGVLHPILTVRRGDGTLAVIDGQRRTLAAIATDTPVVPVLIRTQDGDQVAADTTRIVEQIVSNDQRADLTDGQRAAGVAQLLDLGVSVKEVAQALSVTQKAAKVAGRVGGSDAARAALDTGQLDLEQASIIAAFEKMGDDDAVAQLLDAAENRPYNFPHLARRLTEDRKNARDRAKTLVPFGEAGHPVLTTDPEAGEDVWHYAAEIRTADGEPVEVAEHPDRWSVWADHVEAWIDAETGEQVDEDSVDWDADGPDDTPAEGKRHRKTVTEGWAWETSYWISADDAEQHGYQVPQATPVAHERAAAGVNPDDAARRAAEAADADKAERRRVKALNAAGLAETTLRREHIKALLTRKTAPKGSAGWVAATLAGSPDLLTEGKAGEVLREVVPGADPLTGIADLIDKATDARAQVLMLALVLAALEARMAGSDKSWWRASPQTRWTRDGLPRGAARYLAFLTEHGYTTGPVEKVVTGENTAEDAYTEVTATSGE
ncbi:MULTISPECIES: ParB/RepB/Spo0J family partition protein [unclassified Rhodococcus (in: high G+C Gram-positive bacteria)]|uniref:ParB/RepB/Spo0J family partition protein n=1 Tax=unclassified Rhodococcus (in: high G+C Gram-positive bacteria) TaxID=192944 RepID=UPI001C9B3FE8|nr:MULTISPECIES: ParB N-terminal domain-containing protein [unclassified Rhodococcus (in: high G+C Gram-positive bacteria)]MBY6709179.1 ParB N-terminal domain-containing protein [Rhodococcus sp. BP-241]